LPEKVSCQLTLEELILEAFQKKRYQISGPRWLREQMFSFQAVMAIDTTPEEAHLMLQRALEDRFALQYHFEQKSIPVYNIVATPNGAKLKSAEPPDKQQKLTLNGHNTASILHTSGSFSAIGISLDTLGYWVANIAGLDRPVLNGTDLNGRYKIELRWTPPDDADGNSQANDVGILTALKTQAGLILQKAEMPVNILIIDRANRIPTPN
jgi:uncharacterized protein (TIGR03435 family)